MNQENQENQNQQTNPENDRIKQILAKYPERPKLKRIPFGYMLKGGDPSTLVPDPAIIPFLDEALDQLDAGIALRSVTEWLNSKVQDQGLSISHMGIKTLRKEYRPDFVRKIPKPKVRRMTHAEKAEKLRRHKIAQEKKRVTNAQKRVLKYQEELSILKGNIRDEEEIKKDNSLLIELDYGTEEFKEVEQEAEIIFQPNPGPQTVFFMASEREVLYGGAAGGGKSYALIADPARYFGNKNFRGLILRRTNDELRELIWKTQELYPKYIPGAVWRTQDKEWRFPSGARLWMTYLEREDDVLRYQGQAFTYIGFDELTQYPTPHAWEYMRSRLRDPSGTLPCFMRATSNPGGPGHGWVKRMFIDPAPPGQAFDARDPETGIIYYVAEDDLDFPPEKRGKPLFQRRFIPAKLSDNPYLAKSGDYKGNLLSLNENLKRQLLEGDWNVADGAAFPEFRSNIHVVKPFEIPGNWRKFRSCDFGYSTRQASAVHWYAVHPATGQLIVYRELYVNQLTGTELARKILALEKGEGIAYGVLDSSVWAVRGQSGPSIAEEMIFAGCRWRPSDRSAGSRIAGKNRLHELLRVDPFSNLPGIVFFDTCRQIISDLPVIPSDKDSDDIDPRYATDHAYDSIRYGIMSRPKSGYEVLSTRDTYMPADARFGY